MVLVRSVRGVRVSEADFELEKFKNGIVDDVKCRFNLEGLKDEPVFRAYRVFFWRVGVDPTRIRPAAEALIRRVLGGRPIPRINTAVDAYNLASMTTCVALAAFDISRLTGDITMRFGNAGESFLGIGMDKPMILAGGEIVMADASRLIAVYPYRDNTLKPLHLWLSGDLTAKPFLIYPSLLFTLHFIDLANNHRIYTDI